MGASYYFQRLILQGHAGASELLPLKEELDRATNSEQIRWKRSQLCIKKVAEGLRDMPQLDATTASALTSQVKLHVFFLLN